METNHRPDAYSEQTVPAIINDIKHMYKMWRTDKEQIYSTGKQTKKQVQHKCKIGVKYIKQVSNSCKTGPTGMNQE